MNINSSGGYICANQESYISFLKRTERGERNLLWHMLKSKYKYYHSTETANYAN